MRDPAPERGRVLVVDDEAATASAIAAVLSDAGFSTQVVTDAREAVDRCVDTGPDLVTLDMIMPKLDGASLCLAIRQRSAVPILFISAMRHPADRVIGLRLGADDYLPKPFDNEELVARAEAIIRRTRGRVKADEVRIGDVVLDDAAKEVRHHGVVLPVAPAEYALLRTLASAPGRLFSRPELLSDPAIYVRGEATRAIDVRVGRVRRKLQEAHVTDVALETVRGFGYRLSEITAGERGDVVMAAD